MSLARFPRTCSVAVDRSDSMGILPTHNATRSKTGIGPWPETGGDLADDAAIANWIERLRRLDRRPTCLCPLDRADRCAAAQGLAERVWRPMGPVCSGAGRTASVEIVGFRPADWAVAPKLRIDRARLLEDGKGAAGAGTDLCLPLKRGLECATN